MSAHRQAIIYSDLDGTFLDPITYSFEAVRPIVTELKCRGLPLIFCSSKTRVEIEFIRRQADIHDPFICENGGAVCIPREYFPFPIGGAVERDGLLLIELGTRYSELVATLHRIRRTTRARIIGFSDMSVEEIAADAGLSRDEAERAKQREYDEPFKILDDDPAVIQAVCDRIRQSGLHCTRGGRYFHLMGDNDKGRAVDRLNALYRRQYGRIFTIGLGDSPNDLPMLEAVDLPILVERPDGRHDPGVIAALPHVKRVDGIGPAGWRRALEEWLASER